MFTSKSIVGNVLKTAVLTAVFGTLAANTESPVVGVEAKICQCCNGGTVLSDEKHVKWCWIVPMPCLNNSAMCNDITCTFCGTIICMGCWTFLSCCNVCSWLPCSSWWHKDQVDANGQPVAAPANGAGPTPTPSGKNGEAPKKDDNTMIYVIIGCVVVLGLGWYCMRGEEEEEEEEYHY